MLFSTTVLAGVPKSGFVYEGVQFSSIEEWRHSRQYSNMLFMREFNEKMDALDAQTAEISNAIDMKLLKRFNKNRTTFGINHLTKEYEDGARATMGWKVH